MFDEATQDQIASVLLQAGTPEQQEYVLRHCGVEQSVLQENMKKISEGVDLVRTQAGFDKAIRDFSWCSDIKPSDYAHKLVGFPHSYPSIVCLSFGTSVNVFIRASCIHVNAMRDAIKDA